MTKITKEQKDALLKITSFVRLNEMVKEVLGLDLIDAYNYKVEFGEFALNLLIDSRIKTVDVMREAVEELYNDKEFMANITPELTDILTDMVDHAFYGKYNA